MILASGGNPFSTRHQGLLILQVIRLMNEPGTELTAEPAVIMLRLLHLEQGSADSGPHRRPTAGLRHCSTGNVDDLHWEQ